MDRKEEERRDRLNKKINEKEKVREESYNAERNLPRSMGGDG